MCINNDRIIRNENFLILCIIIIPSLVLFSLKHVTFVYSLVFGWDAQLCHCPRFTAMRYFLNARVSELTYLFVPVLLLWDSVLTLYIPLKCSVNAGQLFVFTFLLSAVVAAKC